MGGKIGGKRDGVGENKGFVHHNCAAYWGNECVLRGVQLY